MHGLGNDFVVINAIAQKINLNVKQIKFIADRHFGIGCDQLLLVEKSQQADIDFRYRIFNANGGEAEQCGNGARCFARFVREKGLTSKNKIRVETQCDVIELFTDDNENVSVNMGMPNFTPASLPMLVESLSNQGEGKYQLTTAQPNVEFGAVSVGNPHIVILVDELNTFDVEGIGATLEAHAAFPQRVNVGFMQVVDRANICLRVFERGVGETKACGTGACAAVVVAQQWGLLDSDVQVQLSGGTLQIQHGQNENIILIGDAVLVFDGEISL